MKCIGHPHYEGQDQEVNKEATTDASPLSMPPAHTYETLLSSAQVLETEVDRVKTVPYAIFQNPKEHLGDIVVRQQTVVELQIRVKEVKEQLERLSRGESTALTDATSHTFLPQLLGQLEQNLERASAVLASLRARSTLTPLQPFERFPLLPKATPGSLPQVPSGSKTDLKKANKKPPTIDSTTQRRPLGVLTQHQASNIGNIGAGMPSGHPPLTPHPVKRTAPPVRPGELNEWVLVPGSSAPQPKSVVQAKPPTGIISGVIGSIQSLWDGK